MAPVGGCTWIFVTLNTGHKGIAYWRPLFEVSFLNWISITLGWGLTCLSPCVGIS